MNANVTKPHDQQLPVGPSLGRRKLLGSLGIASVGLGLSSMAPASEAAAPNGNQQGLTGVWYDPAIEGQGLILEVYPDLISPGVGLLFGGWFTFDTTAGGTSTQRWYSFSGEIRSGISAAQLNIYRNIGGSFAAAPVTFAQSVGTASMTFSSCLAATFAFNLSDGRAGSIALARLGANVACTEAGGALTVSDFGYSGAWHDPNVAGQGIILEINPSNDLGFFAWYTYAPDGANLGVSGQRWFTARAVHADGDKNLTFQILSTTGGVFNTATTVATLPVGTAVLSLTSCTTATLVYNFGSGEFAGKSGSITLERGPSAVGACLFGSTCSLIPSETEGPYPLSSVLSNNGIVRADIRETKTGVPLTVVLKLVNINRSCAPITNAAVYIWHCDKDGVYSGYANQTGGVNATGQIFLRGVQVSDSAGQVVFTTIYPGWYAGRITHIHFQVYLNNALGGNATVTSQIAFPPDVTTAVYNSSLYASRGQNTSVTTFASDNVFRDGTTYQLANVAGSTSTGYVATLIVGVAGPA